MAAEAIRFAVEELPSPRLLGVFMQVGDQRFDADSIRSLYEETDYLQGRNGRVRSARRGVFDAKRTRDP